MSLLRLPPETLKQIFDNVGPSFFHEDLGRLTVCKQWFEFAHPACFKCITLSQEALRIFISSGGMKRLSLLNKSLETLDLELGRGQAWAQVNEQKSNTLEGTALDENHNNDPAGKWIRTLDNDLSQLAIAAQQSHKLRVLHIRAWSIPPPEPLHSPEDYLSLPTMQALLSVENLSVLVLDLSVNFLISSGERGDSDHICPAIGALLPTLRTLRLRLRSICPDVLTLRDDNDSLRLSSVVINLSLAADLPGVTSATHAKRCGFQSGGLLRLKADMQEQAEALAVQMASPKVMRILTHSLPQFKTQSLDILTGKTMVLEDDMQWDEDGKVITEESDEESEISDNSFFNS